MDLPFPINVITGYICIEDNSRIKKLVLKPEYGLVIVVDGGFNREWIYFTLNSVLSVKKRLVKVFYEWLSEELG
jgi:hypothetical protein